MQIKVETKPWKIALPSRNIEIELTTVQSNYHVEMNPSDVGNQDRHIVQEVIKVWHSQKLGCSGIRVPHTLIHHPKPVLHNVHPGNTGKFSISGTSGLSTTGHTECHTIMDAAGHVQESAIGAEGNPQL